MPGASSSMPDTALWVTCCETRCHSATIAERSRSPSKPLGRGASTASRPRASCPGLKPPITGLVPLEGSASYEMVPTRDVACGFVRVPAKAWITRGGKDGRRRGTADSKRRTLLAGHLRSSYCYPRSFPFWAVEHQERRLRRTRGAARGPHGGSVDISRRRPRRQKPRPSRPRRRPGPRSTRSR